MSVHATLRARLPASTPEPHARAILATVPSWVDAFGSDLWSVVLFGSLARGAASGDSDIDLLAVVDGLPRSLFDRHHALLEIWRRVRHDQGLGPIQWNLVVKSPDEARAHSPLYLDIVEDGILVVGRDRFFETVLDEMRARMRTLGSRRVYLRDGSWYWDLKPGLRFGEHVEI